MMSFMELVPSAKMTTETPECVCVCVCESVCLWFVLI